MDKTAMAGFRDELEKIARSKNSLRQMGLVANKLKQRAWEEDIPGRFSQAASFVSSKLKAHTKGRIAGMSSSGAITRQSMRSGRAAAKEGKKSLTALHRTQAHKAETAAKRARELERI